jgi:hypothetical protein
VGKRLHRPPHRGASQQKRRKVRPGCANTPLDLGRRHCHGPLHGRLLTTACQACCALKGQCTTGKERRISRWEHEAILEAVQARLDRSPDKMRVRRQTVEHPFGTIKSWMGSTHFQMKTLKHVSTEMALHVLAYNMKRGNEHSGRWRGDGSDPDIRSSRAPSSHLPPQSSAFLHSLDPQRTWAAVHRGPTCPAALLSWLQALFRQD